MTEKRFSVVDDYLIGYDGDYFNLHKPSDIRSLVKVINYICEENMLLQGEVAHYKLLLMSLEEQAKRITENWKVRK